MANENIQLGKKELLSAIERDRERLIGFLQAFARIDTANPPGDTRKGVNFLCNFLEEENLPYRIIAPQDKMPNILGSFEFSSPGRHLVLNGHIDVFPVGDINAWTRNPWGGEIVGGRIWGRGTVDMKCGTTASLFTYLYLQKVRENLKGRVTLTIVSDEETGGKWGSGYLVEQHGEEVLGDCVLNGEPSSPYTIRFGEKSILWLRFKIKTPGGHGAYPHLSASSTKIAARLILDLERLEAIDPQPPENVLQALKEPGARSAIDNGLGPGAAEVAQRITLNIGTLNGGVKINMLPSECVINADIRLPVGITKEDVVGEVGRILKNYPEVTLEQLNDPVLEANWSNPEGEMVLILKENAYSLAGVRPWPIISLGGTDCRFWRVRGVPAYVYGCSPQGMGAPDESVSINEFLHAVKTHVLSAYDYLSIA